MDRQQESQEVAQSIDVPYSRGDDQPARRDPEVMTSYPVPSITLAEASETLEIPPLEQIHDTGTRLAASRVIPEDSLLKLVDNGASNEVRLAAAGAGEAKTNPMLLFDDGGEEPRAATESELPKTDPMILFDNGGRPAITQEHIDPAPDQSSRRRPEQTEDRIEPGDRAREIPRTGDRITDTINTLENIPGRHQQMVVVTTASKGSTTGELRIYERDANRGWVDTGRRIPINVGRSGLNWGVKDGGMLDTTDLNVQRKREGDKTGPIGLFTIPGAFGLKDGYGIARQLQAAGADANDILPYRQIKPGSQWLGTANGYNSWVDGGRRHRSSEDLHAIATGSARLYEYGLVLGYNGADMFNGTSTTGYPVEQARYKGGSAIFVHVERGPGRPTAGCTSMSRRDMVELMATLERSKNPLWLQVPRSELDKLEGRSFRF